MPGRCGTGCVRDVVYLTFNFLSAVGIVFVNKLCFTRVHFDFPALLTLSHYVLTWAGAEFLLRLRGGAKDGRRKEISGGRYWVLAAVVGWAPAVNNLALRLNPVGLYQVIKLGVTPAIVVMEWRWFAKRISARRAACLIGVTVGVACATAGGVPETSVAGLAASAVWLPIAATYKALWSAVTRAEGWDTLELMCRILPRAMCFQLPLLFITDPLARLPGFAWSPEAVGLLLLSGAGAFCVNLSGFLVMGELSALTHVVAGQAKACVTMIGGYVVWSELYPPLKLGGAIAAIVAMGLYTHYNLQENSAKRSAGKGSDTEETETAAAAAPAADADDAGSGTASPDRSPRRRQASPAAGGAGCR